MRIPRSRVRPRFWNPNVGPIQIRLRYENVILKVLKEQRND